MNKIGFTTVTFRKKNIREVYKIAIKNSISFIEWGADVHLLPGDKSAIAEICSLQKEFEIVAVSYGSYYRLGSEDYDLWKSIIDTASAIGAKIVRIWQGNKSSSEVNIDEYSSMINETRVLADIANEKGLIVAFEFHKNTNNDNGKSAVEFLNAVNKENVKTYWQPFSNENDIDNLKAVLPYLICVHVFEWNEKGKRYSLEHGKNKWSEFIKIINESGVNPYYIIEFVKNDKKSHFSKDARALKEFLK